MIKVTQNLPYSEARKIVHSHVPKANITYAAALKQFKSTSTQTETLEASPTESPSKKKQPKKQSTKFLPSLPTNKPLSV